MKTNHVKRTFALAASALAISTAVVGCRDYDVMDEKIAEDVAIRKEYYNNFVKEFGEPDPNHTWGFEASPEMAEDFLRRNPTFMGTRADGGGNKSGAINVNRNQWAEKEGDKYKTYALARTVNIPGWPGEDGYYHAEGKDPSSTEPAGTPVGDISEYEIQWVSWYVRTHTVEELRLKEADLHVSEFFIQDVSQDKDYNRTTGEVIQQLDNSTEYKMDYLNFQSLDGNWTHINNFNAGANEQPQIPSHIGKNTHRNIMYVMSSGTEDFNYHSSISTDSKTFDKYILIRLEWDEPRNVDWTQYDTKEELEAFLATEPKSNTFHRVGYYLCFDYQSYKEGRTYEGDNIYSNWILKITPGRFKPMDRWPKRLMCEDLGNTYDFDFNDAVFDLLFQSNTSDAGWYDCVVTVQAAGGTLPIWVGLRESIEGLPAKFEIHELLGGNKTSDPVNVQRGGKVTAEPATYRVKHLFKSGNNHVYIKDPVTGDLVVDNTNWPDPTDALMTDMAKAAFLLEIHVKKSTGMENVSGYKIFQSLRNGSPETTPPYQEGYNDGIQIPTGNSFPQLFNCSVDAKWVYEKQPFKEAYKKFVDWVHDEQCDYRLRWDKEYYYKRGHTADGTGTVEKITHSQDKINAWKGSWDYGDKNATSWGTNSDFIDKSNKVYGY